MNIPTTSFHEYTKTAAGNFDPDYAAYLYTKENHNQEVTKLQTRHPLVRLLHSHPWILPVVGVMLFLMGANYNNASPKYQQTFQAPAVPHSAPYIINNVVK